MRSLLLMVSLVLGNFCSAQEFSIHSPQTITCEKIENGSVLVAEWGTCCGDVPECCKCQPELQDVKAFEMAMVTLLTEMNLPKKEVIAALASGKQDGNKLSFTFARSLSAFSLVLQKPETDRLGCDAYVASQVWTLKSTTDQSDALVELVAEALVTDGLADCRSDVKVRKYAGRNIDGVTQKILFLDVDFQLPEPVVTEELDLNAEFYDVLIPFVKEVDGKKVTEFREERRQAKRK